MYEKQQDVRPFKLSDEFLIPYKTQRPDFGFNGLGELTYKRTYARILPDGTKEDWWQTIRRVIEGVYTMQKILYFLETINFFRNFFSELAQVWHPHTNYSFVGFHNSLVEHGVFFVATS